MDKIRILAIIKEVQKGGVFRCYLDDNKTHELIAHPCGKMRKSQIILCVGDIVTVELSKYDLTRGRIIRRH